MDRIVSAEEKLDPLVAKGLSNLRRQLCVQMRRNLISVFTSSKMKTMYYLVDSCLQEDAADGKLIQDYHSYKLYSENKVLKLRRIYEYKYVSTVKRFPLSTYRILIFVFHCALLLKENTGCLMHMLHNKRFKMYDWQLA